MNKSAKLTMFALALFATAALVFVPPAMGQFQPPVVPPSTTTSTPLGEFDLVDAGAVKTGFLDAGLIQVQQPTGKECGLAIESAGTEAQYMCFNRGAGTSASGTYISFNPASNATTFSTAAGLTVAGGDLTISAGRFISRNASGGFSFGAAGTQYWGMAAGSNELNGNAAEFDIGGLSVVRIDNDLLGTTQTPAATTFCTSPTVVAHNGSFAFEIDVGTGCGAATATVTFPTAAASGWSCACYNITSPDSFVIGLTGGSTTTATLKQYSRTTGLAANWVDSENIRCQCNGL